MEKIKDSGNTNKRRPQIYIISCAYLYAVQVRKSCSANKLERL